MARYRLGFAVALVVFALDQLAKWMVTGPLGIRELGDQLVLLPIFNFTYTQNNGISLGLFNAQTEVGRWMLVAVTSAIAIGVAVWVGRGKNHPDPNAPRKVVRGALRNILDPARHRHAVHLADLHLGG